MGIPSYFSFIIKNYPKIIKKYNYYQNNNIEFHNLFMDCNSIVYDIVNSLDEQKRCEPNIDEMIIELVIDKIMNYILFVKPSKRLFIAFDGVAPFAKMSQQRTRRYKSQMMDTFINGIVSENKWNTANITPGTKFMELLSNRMNEYFSKPDVFEKINVDEIIVSASDEPGEGEHKLFQYIRNNSLEKENVIIYGLDSDLIMLAIFHYHLYDNCYIFREAPEFMKSMITIEDTNKPDDNYVMDIGLLRKSILSEMKFNEEQRIYDYVFLCFFLGNDFLPHFPALNIRTHGISTLLEIYSNVFNKNPTKYLTMNNNTDKPTIDWKNVKLYMKELVKHEQQFIIEEYYGREKYDTWKWGDDGIRNNSNKEQREKVLQNLPIIYRKEEKYISPNEHGWEERYYKSLFHGSNHDIKQHICINYLEGLEWVFLYYSGKGFDWRWTYEYHYPPLLKDLFMYIQNDSNHDIKFINQKRNFYSQELQLVYVLPKSQNKLLKNGILEQLIDKYPQLYSEEPYEFQWAFCRYFWESHVCFPKINLNLLEKLFTVDNNNSF